MHYLTNSALATALLAVTMASDTERVLMANAAFAAAPVREVCVNNARSRLMQHQGLLRLEFQLPTLGDALVTLYNATGHVVLKERVNDSGQHVSQVAGQMGATAPFTMRIEQDGVIVSKKLVIEQA